MSIAPEPRGPLGLSDEGGGPAVLLLHGQPGTRAEMVAVAEALGEGYRILNVDRRGYGETAGRAVSLDEQADELAELLVARSAAPAVVVGFSFGGGVALRLAQRHPATTAGLVLVSSVGGMGSVTFGDVVLAAPVLGTAASALTLLGYGQVAPRILKRLRRGALAANALHEPAMIPIREVQAFIDEQRSLVREHEALTAALGEVRCPSIVLHGDCDLIIAPEAGRDLAERLSAELVVLEGLGHLVNRDDPATIASAARRLVERIGAVD